MASGPILTITLNSADFVEFTLGTVGGQQVVTSLIQARFLPGADGLPGNLVVEPLLIIEGFSTNSSLVTSLAAGANTTQAIAGLLSGADVIEGSVFSDTLLGYAGNDLITGGAGNDRIDGGDGINVAVYSGDRTDYTVILQPNGSYLVVDQFAGRDGADTIVGITQLQFADQTLSLTSITPSSAFSALVNGNISQAKAISAAYQILLGGVPSQAGYDFLIKANLSANFGAGPGRSSTTRTFTSTSPTPDPGKPVGGGQIQQLGRGQHSSG